MQLLLLTILFFGIGLAVYIQAGLDLWVQVVIHICSILIFGIFVVRKKNSLGWVVPLFKVTGYPLILIGLGVSLSYFMSANQSLSQPILLNWINYGLVFYLGLCLQSRKKVILYILLFLFLSVVGIQWFHFFILKINQPDAGMFNPNVLAGYLCLTGFTFLVIPFKNKVGKLSVSLIAILFLLSLVLTQSTGAILGMLTGLIFLYVINYKIIYQHYFKIFSRYNISFYLGVGCIIIVLLLIIPELTRPYLTDRFRWWVTAIRMFIHSPIWGMGMDNFSRYYYQFKVSGLNSLYAHSFYLQIAAEQGIFAVIGFIWLVINIIRGEWKNRVNKYNVIFILGVIAVSVHNLVDYNLYVPAIGYIYWFYLGLCTPGVIWYPKRVVYVNYLRLGIVILLFLFLDVTVKSFITDRYLARGIYFYQKKKLLPAETEFNRLILLNRRHSIAYHYIAQVYIQHYAENKMLSWLNRAITALSLAIKYEPQYTRFYLEKAWLHYLVGEKDAAKQVLSHAKLLGGDETQIAFLEKLL